MSGNRVVGLVAMLFALSRGVESRAAETWADANLPTMPGLELWLDAGREVARRAAAGERQLENGNRLSIWHDASGTKRHALQANPLKQPKMVRVAPKSAAPDRRSGWVVRFDGEDDHLRVLGLSQRLKDFTLFVVAAPHSNRGQYRGFISFNLTGKKDYETGLNLDMNAAPSVALSNLNLEGRGFGGARNLMKTAVPFGTLHVIEVVGDHQAKQVRLAFDGVPAAQRISSGTELSLDDVTLGARHTGNAGADGLQGFLHGDLVEVLLYSRSLADSELQTVRSYLQRKHAALGEALPGELKLAGSGENVESLVTVPNPPPVQMLVPGFTVRELPVELTNINNLRYRPDGKLYALAYGGDIWLLNDANGDGLADSKVQFFENKGRLRGPIGMAVIPPGHAALADETGKRSKAARGVIVASKGKASAILDLDGDDLAETERVIATGWKEIPQNVDAIGVAIHPDDGAIYFGLGTAAYNNAYLLDNDGKSAFDLGSERGTIQRIEPDLSKRTTICTGVRFTIGMEFNADKLLIVTEQEGATWLPNGNPFDELLHIQLGRHYGFPPRHPKHLPQVFDEPSLFDYGPQHQSTCGMAFNLPLQPGGPIFGPESWRGDALVCGESRGKLYRTQIVKDQQGEYVARNQLIACLGMLTVDCCLTPRGDLLVACHSGGPDWGTGPSGIGKIYLIRHEGEPLPQPTAVWAAGRQEVRVVFNRPLDPQHLRSLASQSKISHGEYVAAGDRFETIRPGYAVTQLQQSKPRYNLPILAASVTPDRRTLILSTAPHPSAAGYAITLPGLGRESHSASSGELPQHPQIDLAYALHGVLATWQPRDPNQSVWNGWLPHLDLSVARAFSSDDSEYARFWHALEQPGTLTLETQIDPRGLFLPVVQPGSKLDYDEPDDRWVSERAIQLHGSQKFSVHALNSENRRASVPDGARHSVSLAVDGNNPLPLRIRLEIETRSQTLALRPAWSATLADGQVRTGALALRRFLLPWAPIDAADSSPAAPRVIPELAGGNWGRGRQIFLSAEAGCAKCHAADQTGSRIGPDLANLVHRDYASVLRDVTQPSFAINPDFITYVASLHDGRVLTGALRSEGEQLLIGDKDGKVTSVPRSAISELKPSPLSIMPDGITAKLGAEKTTDLLTYLLQEPPHMPRDVPLPAPALRTKSQVDAVLAGGDSATFASSNAATQPNLKPLHLLLVAGKKDHGPGEHDYPAWLDSWRQLLPAAAGVTVSTAMEWPTAEQIQAADTIVFYQKGSWNAERATAIDAHLAKGGGLVYLHWAVEGGSAAREFAQRIGLASSAREIKFRHGPLELDFQAAGNHPIARNYSRAAFYDESYWLLPGDPTQIQVLATGVEQGEPRPLFWTLEQGRGRVFVSILGHYSWTFDDPLFRILLLRGIAWSARESVDRFNELSTIGVTLAN
jgi:putative heme-binding domain-containing protein